MRDGGNDNDSPAIVAPTGLEFKITDLKLHVPVVTLSKKKWHKTFRTIKNRILKNYKMEQIQITNDCSK